MGVIGEPRRWYSAFPRRKRRQSLNTNWNQIDSIRSLEDLVLGLPSMSKHHARTSRLYTALADMARREVERLFSGSDDRPHQFEPFGELVFPYHRMGAVDSLNLFGLDELIIFSFYWQNRVRYRRVLDAGANIGLHSIILSRCGYEVRAFEPDPQHYKILQRNLAANNCGEVEVFQSALSSTSGTAEFVRVLGNTTGSHIAGSKSNPYGELERFQVDTEDAQPLIGWADLVKLDIEGHEPDVLLATSREDWLNTDAFVEVQSESNAASILRHFSGIGVGLFAQKTNWHPVIRAADMPTSYREGSLFISCKREMSWS